MAYRCPLCNVILGAPGMHHKKHNMTKNEYLQTLKEKSPDAIASCKELIAHNANSYEYRTARRVRK